MFLATGLMAACNHHTPSPKYITYLTSTKDSLIYCNGSDMNSTAFAQTITKLHHTHISTSKLNKTQLLNKTLALMIHATNSRIKNLSVSYHRGVVTIPPIDGWAGVSIYLCAFKPLVEKNLKQYHFVKKVVW